LPKQGIEQTLIAIQRWDVLPNRNLSVYEFMKNNLKLFEDECQLFSEMKGTLLLKHCHSLWKYLDKVFVQKQGRWHQVDKMHIDPCFKSKIKDSTIEKKLQKFVHRFEQEAVWQFLMDWMEFIERRLCDHEKLISTKANQHKLSEWLKRDILDDRSEIDKKKLFDAFPDDVLLSQTQEAYRIVASEFKQRYSDE